MPKVLVQKLVHSVGLLLLVASFHGKVLADQSPPIKIGVSLPLSGPIAKMGVAVRNSILLADERYDVDNKVEFVFEDDTYTASKTVSAVRKLIAHDKVRGLIIFGSGPSLAVNSIAEQNRIPMVAISTATDVTKGFEYVVRHWLDPDIEAKIIDSEINRRNYKSIAIVTTLNDGTLALRDEFLKLNSKEIVYDEQLDPAETKFHSVATKIKLLNPSAVFILLMPPQSGLVARQLRSSGYTGDFFGAHPLEIDEELKRKGNALVGAWFATTDDRTSDDFNKAYFKLYGEEPIVGCGNGHDIAKLFIQGVRSKDTNAYLHSVQDFDGALGVYGSNGNNGFAMSAILKTVDANGVRLLRNGSS